MNSLIIRYYFRNCMVCVDLHEYCIVISGLLTHMNSTLKMLNNLEIKFFEGMPDILTYTMDMICLYIYITYI